MLVCMLWNKMRSMYVGGKKTKQTYEWEKNNKTWIYLKRISKKFDKYIKDKKEKKYKKIEARVLKNV